MSKKRGTALFIKITQPLRVYFRVTVNKLVKLSSADISTSFPLDKMDLGMEDVSVAGQTVQVPRNQDVLDGVLSLTAWNSLRPEVQQKLVVRLSI